MLSVGCATGKSSGPEGHREHRAARPGGRRRRPGLVHGSAKRRIARASADGAIASFGLATPVARLGRLTVAPDGAVWFAESTVASVTRLHDGRLLATSWGRSPQGSLGCVAVRRRHRPGWCGLGHATEREPALAYRSRRQRHGIRRADPQERSGRRRRRCRRHRLLPRETANKIGRLAGGRFEEFAVPTPRAGFMALAVAPDGAAWFTQLRGHQLGRLHGGTIKEFELPRPDARPFGITVDGANNVWYTDLSGWLGRLDAGRARAR